MTLPATASRSAYAGLFLTSLTTLMYELLLTRIFSVIIWYHFAFMAISVAMFGLAVGSVIVYILPAAQVQRPARLMGMTALLFAGSIALCLPIQLKIPHIAQSSMGLVSEMYVVTAIPFLLSGICICLALTKLPPMSLGRLYAADLAGAAVGCVLFVVVINLIDGVTAIFFLSAVGSAASVIFFLDEMTSGWRKAAAGSLLFFIAFTGFHTYLVSKQTPLFQLTWVKGNELEKPIYEKWNSFSRIQVTGDVDPRPFGWGFSPYLSSAKTTEERFVQIDAAASTVLTHYRSLSDLDYLKYDIVNLVHFIRQDADVFVIGAGGGRDLLSALVFNQKSATAAEINPNILYAVNTRFGDFTNHLDRNPKITFIHDEARSFLARSKVKFDIIQVSFIDTWAATAAGAFVMTENSLYTLEAWKIFLEHLQDNGILTFSRWYFKDRPGEIYRLTSLATESLLARGVRNPRDHIMIARYLWKLKTGTSTAPSGIGTIFVSNQPFSDADIQKLNDAAGRLGFELAFSPKSSLDPVFDRITAAGESHAFTSHFPIDITPPTDDRPFFFNMLRLSSILDSDLMEQGANYLNMVAVYVLDILLILILVLTFCFIVLPLLFTVRTTGQKGVLPFFLFFASIGAGFMLIEVSLMQRLIVFLGHPTYSLTVVLFSLLLSAGLGSYSTKNLPSDRFVSSASLRFAALLTLLALAGVLVRFWLPSLQGAATPSRILIAILLLFPLGFFMGMAFPLGMKIALSRLPQMTPWFWGINGSVSVCASVISFAIALSWGITVGYCTGILCYVLAFLGFLWAAKRHPIES